MARFGRGQPHLPIFLRTAVAAVAVVAAKPAPFHVTLAQSHRPAPSHVIYVRPSRSSFVPDRLAPQVHIVLATLPRASGVHPARDADVLFIRTPRALPGITSPIAAAYVRQQTATGVSSLTTTSTLLQSGRVYLLYIDASLSGALPALSSDPTSLTTPDLTWTLVDSIAYNTIGSPQRKLWIYRAVVPYTDQGFEQQINDQTQVVFTTVVDGLRVAIHRLSQARQDDHVDPGSSAIANQNDGRLDSPLAPLTVNLPPFNNRGDSATLFITGDPSPVDATKTGSLFASLPGVGLANTSISAGTAIQIGSLTTTFFRGPLSAVDVWDAARPFDIAGLALEVAAQVTVQNSNPRSQPFERETCLNAADRLWQTKSASQVQSIVARSRSERPRAVIFIRGKSLVPGRLSWQITVVDDGVLRTAVIHPSRTADVIILRTPQAPVVVTAAKAAPFTVQQATLPRSAGIHPARDADVIALRGTALVPDRLATPQITIQLALRPRTAQHPARDTDVLFLRTPLAPVVVATPPPASHVVTPERQAVTRRGSVTFVRPSRSALVPDRLARQLNVLLQQRRRSTLPHVVLLRNARAAAVASMPAPQIHVISLVGKRVLSRDGFLLFMRAAQAELAPVLDLGIWPEEAPRTDGGSVRPEPTGARPDERGGGMANRPQPGGRRP